jgi:hypothetical protein
LNQVQPYSTSSLRSLNFFYSSFLDELKRFVRDKKASNAPLLALSSQLYAWNVSRLSQADLQKNAQHITIEDVNFLKKMIHIAMHRSSIKSSEVIADQLFFLAIGAIQVQFQTGSDQAWQLVDQSVKDFLQVKKQKRTYAVSLICTAIAVSLSISMMTPTQLNAVSHPIQTTKKQTIVSSTDPVTISMLQLAYKKMQNGTCQLPQAGMLPPEQRHAFLSFVNHGVIEVEHVENLRLALGYVDCLYPQKLMGSSITLANLK